MYIFTDITTVLHKMMGKKDSVEDRFREERADGKLVIAHGRMGNFRSAIMYHEKHLKVAKEVGDRSAEGKAYGNLGNAYQSLGDFQKAIEYHEKHLNEESGSFNRKKISFTLLE